MHRFTHRNAQVAAVWDSDSKNAGRVFRPGYSIQGGRYAWRKKTRWRFQRYRAIFLRQTMEMSFAHVARLATGNKYLGRLQTSRRIVWDPLLVSLAPTSRTFTAEHAPKWFRTIGNRNEAWG